MIVIYQREYLNTSERSQPSSNIFAVGRKAELTHPKYLYGGLKTCQAR